MSRIKECFTSRFHLGVLMEADYKQLEVCVLAVLSGDKQLKSDLLSGMDLHELRAKELFRTVAVTKEQRRIAKALSFQLQYGSGPNNMAVNLGIPINVAKAFINLYYERYPAVADWQNANIALVKS